MGSNPAPSMGIEWRHRPRPLPTSSVLGRRRPLSPPVPRARGC